MRTIALLTLVFLLAAMPVVRPQIGPAPGANPLPAGPHTHAYQESDYILLVAGTDYVAQNARTGQAEFTDPDAGVVLNGALGALPPEGGRVFVRAGEYVFGTSVNLRSHVQLDGAPGAVLSAPGLVSPLLRATGLEDVTVARLTLRGCGGTALRIQGGARLRVESCTFEDVQGPAIQNVSDPLLDLWVEGCVVEGAGLGSKDGDFDAGINLYKVTNPTVVDNRVRSCGCTGISVWSSSGRVLLRGNDSSGNNVNAIQGQGHGIIVGGGTSDVRIEGNATNDNGYNGIEANSGSLGARYVITGNTAVGNGVTQQDASKGAGIYITHRDVVVADNICVQGQGVGIKVGWADDVERVLVHGNIVGENGRSGAGHPVQSSGISLLGPSAGEGYLVEVRVFDNIVYDLEGGTQHHAIHGNTGVDGVHVERNRVFGHANAEIVLPSGSANRVSGNDGFATESRGTATVLAGSSAWTVPHGLDVTPDPAGIGVTPLADVMSDGQARGWWIEAVTSSDFTLRFSSDLPLDVPFAWRCDGP